MALDAESKQSELVGSRELNSSSSLAPKEQLRDPDQAYNFLTQINASTDATASVDLKKLRRKIDWYIVPIMFLCYTMQFIDKVSLNVRNHLIIRLVRSRD